MRLPLGISVICIAALASCGQAPTDDDGSLATGTSSDPATTATASTGGTPSDTTTTANDVTGDSGQVPDDGMSPRILEVLVVPQILSEGDFVSITAQVTDPDGLDDLVGVSLRVPSGGGVYAFFNQVSLGTFEVTMSWDAIHAVTPIEFEADLGLELVIEAMDSMGNTGEKVVVVTLTCGGQAACNGTCTPLGTHSDCSGCGDACGVGFCNEGRCVVIDNCGNGRIDLGEQCDGNELGNVNCQLFGYPPGGMLLCNDRCMLDTSAC